MSVQVHNEIPTLTANQRNLYLYYLAHIKRHPNTPCYVPRNSMTTNSTERYIKIIDSLEKLNLFTVDRTAVNYTGWIILPPKR
jgi:hypothetical protein